MKQTKVKICGLRREEDIACVNGVLPDFVGFIFDPTRRRYIDPQTAAALRMQLASGIRAVGVFVNADPERILRITEEVSLDMIQLHGNEDEQYIRHLKKLTSLPLINAIRIETKEDVNRAISTSADLILLDNGLGGTGTSFDWSLVDNVQRDFILAGGLSPENAAEAISSCHPWGLDASSSLETEGFKDPEKIRQFIEAVRKADSDKRKQNFLQESENE